MRLATHSKINWTKYFFSVYELKKNFNIEKELLTIIKIHSNKITNMADINDLS